MVRMWGAVVVILLVLSSCQSEFDKVAPLVSNDTNFVNPKNRKVLVLVADGLRGVALKEVAPPNISALLKKSTFSYYSLSDEIYNEGTSWADMFTGVTKDKHGVTTTSFANNKLGVYPSVFKRIKDANKDIRTATFSYSSDFTNNLTSDESVNSRTTYNTDAEVHSSLLQELANEDAGVVVGMYNNVNIAGNANTYESSNLQYKNAILEFDSYVGQALTALKKRKNYSKENWLVVITSSRGGAATVPNDNTIFSNPKANTFTILYNDQYKAKLIDKPFTGYIYDGSFVRFHSPDGPTPAAQVASAIRAELRFPDDLKASSLNPLNFNGGDFTIELKVRKNLNTIGTQNINANRNTFNFSWPAFFSRKTSLDANNTGWNFGWEGGGTRFAIWRGISAGPNHAAGWGAEIKDLHWHSIAVTVKTEGTQRFIRAYHDGNPVGNKAEIPAVILNSIDNYNAPLTIGYLPVGHNDPFDGNISDIKIWRTALPDETIKQFACDTYVSTSHPYYDYLASYWPCRDGAGGRFKNEILTDGRYDFVILKGGTPLVKGTELGNNTIWEKSNYIVCPSNLANISSAVPNTKDITPQILSWLGIPVIDTWNLDGRVYLNN